MDSVQSSKWVPITFICKVFAHFKHFRRYLKVAIIFLNRYKHILLDCKHHEWLYFVSIKCYALRINGVYLKRAMRANLHQLQRVKPMGKGITDQVWTFPVGRQEVKSSGKTQGEVPANHEPITSQSRACLLFLLLSWDVRASLSVGFLGHFCESTHGLPTVYIFSL